MKQIFFMFLLVPFLFVGCKKELSVRADAIACLDGQFDDYTLLEEVGTECIYTSMYFYKEEYWTVFSCCVCDMIVMAVDCNGNNLCHWEGNCMEKFLKQSEYMFSFTID